MPRHAKRIPVQVQCETDHRISRQQGADLDRQPDSKPPSGVGAEWKTGIDFILATGQACSDTRQGFVLLSDTLGVSMLTIALNHARPAGATEATLCGPFHTEDARRVPAGLSCRASASTACAAPGPSRRTE